MIYQLSNNFLSVTFSTHGAEIQSIKDQNTGAEYIWQADPNIWNRHAPILFPIVGRLRQDEYQYKGKTYQMGQHGFARDMIFQVENQEQDNITFLLKDNRETLAQYPFHFELRVTYTLLNNLLREAFSVKNTGTTEMIFGIGGHPGFNVPISQKIQKEDYYFKFLPSIARIQIPLKAPYLDWENRSLAATDSLITLSSTLFRHDALIFELPAHNKVSLRTEKSHYHINVWINGAPYVGIWSQYPKTANFVCIEPWWGLADTCHHDGKLETKLGMNHLKPGQIFEAYFEMAFHDGPKELKRD